MAHRLKPASPQLRPRLSRRQPWALFLLTLPVLVLHGCIADSVDALRQRWTGLAEMPQRLSVSYVRELQQSQPPAATPARPAQPVPRPVSQLAGPGAASAPALEASAPAPEAEIQPPAEVMPGTGAEVAASAAAPEPPAEATPAAPPAPAAASSPMASAAVQPAASESVAASMADDEAADPTWPPSTRLRYELTGNYRGAVTGEAQVEWIREGSRYQVHLDVSVGPSFAPLISRRMSSDGRLTSQGIEPQRYDEDTRVLFSSRRRVTVFFQGEQLTLANGRVEASAPGMQDAASQFVQLTWLFLTGRQTLRPGLMLELPLALPRRQYRWRYEVLGQESLNTPMGSLDTWHLKPSVLAGGGDLTAEVWLAPTLQYLPVRLRIRQDEQTYIDLMLKSAPAQAAATGAPIVKPSPPEAKNPNPP